MIAAHSTEPAIVADVETQAGIEAGNAHLAADRAAQALVAYDQALRHDPASVVAMSNRALALRMLGRDTDAEAACRAAIALNPAHVDAWNNLGLMLVEQDRLDEAADALGEARALAPQHATPGAGLCALLLRAARWKDAAALALQLVREHPDSADAWNALAHAQLETGSFGDALASLSRVLALAPNDGTALLNRAIIHLLRGEFAKGLEGYEWRRRVTNQLLLVRRSPSPEWVGESLDGKTVLVCAEQGAGDMIQFVRYAALLRERGAKCVIVESPPLLASLLETAPGVDAVVHTDAPFPAHDLHVPLLSLPYRCGTRIETIPASIPYLSVGASTLADEVRQAPGLRVGLVWGGNPRHKRDRYRSISLPELLAAVQCDGVTLFSLQQGAAAQALTRSRSVSGIVDLGSRIATFEDTASVVNALDLVITVDTSMAHLGGAIGCPTWTLLSYVPDWRWMLDRHDTPWYPTTRLFRQATIGDWSGPLDAVRSALAQLAATQETRIARTAHPRGPERVPPATSKINVARAFDHATSLHVAGNAEAALVAYDALLAAAPHHVETLNNSAVLLSDRREMSEACRRLAVAIALKPDYGQAHANIALFRNKLGDYSGALAAFAEAVRCEPTVADWWRDYANCAAHAGQFDVALKASDHALALAPTNASYVADRAVALHDAGRVDEAISTCQEALRLDPLLLAAHMNLAQFLRRALRWDDAEHALYEALSALPGDPALMLHLADLYHGWGRLEQARNAATDIVALHPTFPGAHNVLGIVLVELGEMEGARAAFSQALALDPANANAGLNLALDALLDGNFADGLRGFECRRTLQNAYYRARRIPGVEWDGGDLTGKTILIQQEQGLGDLLQFVRYAIELKARGAREVIVECFADAAQLVATAPGVDAITIVGAPLPPYDVFVPLMSLPYRCNTRLNTIPANAPYLVARGSALSDTVRRASGLKVGIVWAGNPSHQRDRYRSIPLVSLLSAVQCEGVSLFSLQKGTATRELIPWREVSGITDLAPQLTTIDDTAAAVDALDLVISVDTAVAHLAGALARPVWTLHALVPDWRWLHGRDDTPWYPTMHLFRQADAGDWLRPLGQVRAALQDLVRSRALPTTGLPRAHPMLP